jgi:uncharacterized protein involved in propanediol utilization
MERELTGNLITCTQDSSPKLGFGNHRLPFRKGYGVAIAHHGELFQGVFEGANGRLKRGLVSIPCGIFKSEANFTPDDTDEVKVEPLWRVKTRKVVELALASIGTRKCGGLLCIRSNIPIGWGLGSSTSDVTAAIRAIADALGESLVPQQIADLAVQAETASDSTMFDESMVLFAQREGTVIEDFEHPLPKLEILGFNTDPHELGIDTLNFAPVRYSWREIESFRPMIGLLRRAVELRSPQLLGQVASASATINQLYLPKPHFQHLKAITEKVGAVGLQVAHTGTIAGLLFDPNDALRESRIRHAQSLLSGIGINQTWFFQTRENGLAEERRRGDET